MPSKWTRKRKINILIFFIFLIIFIGVLIAPLDWFLWGSKRIEWTVPGFIPDLSFSGGPNGVDYPRISYNYVVTFTAIGSFSLNNPINVDVQIRNVTIPNLLDYYQIVGFSYSYNYPLKHNAEETIDSGKLQLNYVGKDTYFGGYRYEAKGVLIWMQEGESHGPIVAPQSPRIFLTPEAVNSIFPAVLSISSVSDTLTQTYTENTNKLALALGTFSIILIIPILETIFVKEDEVKQQSQPQTKRPQQQRY